MPLHHIPPAYYQPLPPAVTDDPTAFANSLSGLTIVTLIFLAGIPMMVWRMVDRPEPLNNPRTVFRLVILLTCFSGVLRNGPDVLSWGLWPRHVTTAAELQAAAAWRFCLAHWNRVLDGVSWPFQMAAAILLYLGVEVIEFQLGKQPIPIHLYPKWQKLWRPFMIAAIVIALSLAIAFRG